jgi:hypothetical protein
LFIAFRKLTIDLMNFYDEQTTDNVGITIPRETTWDLVKQKYLGIERVLRGPKRRQLFFLFDLRPDQAKAIRK